MRAALSLFVALLIALPAAAQPSPDWRAAITGLPPLTPVGRAFPYSGSVTHLDGVDCACADQWGLLEP